MDRDFDKWLSGFQESIANYGYYVDFSKVNRNMAKAKQKLSVLNQLVGSKHPREDMLWILANNPEVKEYIPLLIAVRDSSISVAENGRSKSIEFGKKSSSDLEIVELMDKTGLLDFIATRITNVVDYMSGVEVGLDSNGRKNRGGHLMEDLVYEYIRKTGVECYKEMTISAIRSMWNVDLSSIDNSGKTEKRFDFVVKTKDMVYGIETNFYASGGSKLNETARSYKMIAEESRDIRGFTFVWVTDGIGWNSARNNLLETFQVLPTLYNINDLNNGALERLFNH